MLDVAFAAREVVGGFLTAVVGVVTLEADFGELPDDFRKRKFPAQRSSRALLNDLCLIGVHGFHFVVDATKLTVPNALWNDLTYFKCAAEASMVRHWQDKSRQCPVCNQPHHFVYVLEPRPGTVYAFECPVTKQVSDLSASEYVKESTILLPDDGVPVVAAVARFSN